MENIGHIKTHTVTIVELATGNETQLDVQSGENMSDGTYVIWCSFNDQEMTSTEDKYFKTFQQFRDVYQEEKRLLGHQSQYQLQLDRKK